MSSDAGKVYFVLYLAVVLELLIIIVERDEAEEGLLRKQRETMKIVESILSQLQSGAGTEGINTRPQDEITLPPPGIDLKEIMGTDIKSSRTYVVEVGVTDISADLKRREGERDKDYNQRLMKLIQLGNVEELEYQIFYSDSKEANNAPRFLTKDEMKERNINFDNMSPGEFIETGDGVMWQYLGLKKLILDQEATFNNLDLNNITVESIAPIYPDKNKVIIGDDYAPKDLPPDSIFYYSQAKSLAVSGSIGAGDLQKRSFVVSFQPSPDRDGWYKLRFASQTNRILGVAAKENPQEIDQDATVNIGTVQLTVKDLNKVRKELTLKLDNYQLPNFDDFAKTGDISGFDAGLAKSMNLASTDPDASDIMNKIRLYGYIAKLLAPGMSINFDQNKGDIEFNIRVIKPEVKISQPVVTMTTYVPCFDRIPAVFEFTISPYQSETANIVEGKVLDINGSVVSRIECTPLDKISSEVATPQPGVDRDYRGTVTETLPPGKYTMQITHKLGSRQADKTSTLEIFKTGLTDDSEAKITNMLSAFAYYGYSIGIDAIPNSGGKIKSNQFRIYLTTDADQQRPPFEGLSVPNDRKVQLSTVAKNVTARVAWVQPFTGKEIDLYPAKTFPIKQEEPGIALLNTVTDVSGTSSKVKITVSNIKISKPLTGGSADPEVSVRVGQPKKADGLKTYDFLIEPTIDGDLSSGYIVYLELDGKLPPGEDKIRGIINLPVYAKATNPENGKVSEEIQQNLTINVNFEPTRQRGGGKRRRR